MTSGTPEIRLFNTLTKSKDRFDPIDKNNVRMYVCGPTVYDYAHIGNARPAIVFDVLYRLLRHTYGEDHVTYVRNITDVDDKINTRAVRDFPDEPLNEAIAKVTEKTTQQYQSDMKALGCLDPNFEPRATAHIDGMVKMIQTLIDKGNAYLATGQEGTEVLFNTQSMPDYGRLSRRNLDEQKAGARVAVEQHKKNPADFVLWKQSTDDQPGWDGAFSFEGEMHTVKGRPGWHIECSVMSKTLLGETFDIHGGGLDLIFPHHENELAQSRCAHGNDAMANVWMHNGFLQVEGEKMSKSLGNFYTVNELLGTAKFGGRLWLGEALRLVMFGTHYRQPTDWTIRALADASEKLRNWAGTLLDTQAQYDAIARAQTGGIVHPDDAVISSLSDDLNMPLVLMRLEELHEQAVSGNVAAQCSLLETAEFLGLLRGDRLNSYFRGIYSGSGPKLASPKAMHLLDDIRVANANNAKTAIKDLSAELLIEGVEIEFQVEGHVTYQVSDNHDWSHLVEKRLAALTDKDFATADKIRDDLAAEGIQLMDYKDPDTGERKTKWEVKR